MDIDAREKFADLAKRAERERKRFYARRPKPAADLMAQIIAKRGYAATKGAERLAKAWNSAAMEVLGEEFFVQQTRVAGLSRGKLEVIVANHVVLQEINFQQARLLQAVQQADPELTIKSLRFKTGRI